MKKTLREAIVENMARHEGQRLSVDQLAAVLNVRPSSVHEAYSRLRKSGTIAPSERQVTRAALPLPANGAQAVRGTSPEALLGVLERGEILDAPSRLRLASHLARTAPSPVAVAAIKLLATDLDPQAKAMAGPPDPLTDAERAERLAKLIVACGREVHRRALELAERAWSPAPAAEPDASELIGD
jgi:DNA-binding transcriptional MocR family regulator